MARGILDQPLRPLERWRTGEPIRARKLNRHVDTTNKLQRGVPSPTQTVVIARPKGGTVGGGAIRRLLFSSMGDDVLVCTDPTGEIEGSISVAKPWLLRRTPFEGEGNERNGIRYTYGSATDPTDSTERVGLRLSDEFSERQHIRPFYLPGDSILATLLTPEDIGLGDDVVWAEVPSARAWTRMR